MRAYKLCPPDIPPLSALISVPVYWLTSDGVNYIFFANNNISFSRVAAYRIRNNP